MKIHYIVPFLMFLFLISCKTETYEPDISAKNGLEYVFDIEAVPEIYIETTTAEWNNLLSYFDQNPKNEEHIPCDFVFVKGDQRDTIRNIGMRIRGNTSRRRPEGKTGEMHNPHNPDWHHAHFALNFKKYVKGQKLRKLEKLNLKWFKDDGVYAREVYCYDLFERFGVWTSPQSSYCRLFIKIKEDKKWINYGVYQLIEPVDKEFVKNRIGNFNDSDGNLWKANWGADFANADRSRMGVEHVTLTETYQPVYDLKTNKTDLESAKNQLISFINNLNTKQGSEFKSWVESAMDVPLFLKTYAVNVICGMWDDYWNNSNNFYFYFDSNNKFHFIPYDYDNTLGTSFLMNNSGTQDVLNWGKDSNPLVKKIISFPEYKTLYINYLKELNDPDKDLFYYTRSVDRISSWHSMIRNYVSNDTGEDMQIVDVPASWGNCPQYRLMTTTNNYFKVRGENLPE